ncbi:MAG: hypothetical protein M3O20_15805 [Acidobacteriota bacterium]|nr:hypothetical protein [Acidobacteriota bacterium]
MHPRLRYLILVLAALAFLPAHVFASGTNDSHKSIYKPKKIKRYKPPKIKRNSTPKAGRKGNHIL